MYNPRSYAISIEKILKTSQSMTGDIENNPLLFIESFLDEIYKKNENKRFLIDEFRRTYAVYENIPLLKWYKEDAAQMVEDLRKIVK